MASPTTPIPQTLWHMPPAVTHVSSWEVFLNNALLLGIYLIGIQCPKFKAALIIFVLKPAPALTALISEKGTATDHLPKAELERPSWPPASSSPPADSQDLPILLMRPLPSSLTQATFVQDRTISQPKCDKQPSLVFSYSGQTREDNGITVT